MIWLIYEIDTGQRFKINWNAKGSARILQNVVNLLNTYRYEVAYARTIGIDLKWKDRPSREAAAILANDIINLISTKEPRAKVRKVEYLGTTATGDLSMKVVVEI